MALSAEDQMLNQSKRDWARENGWPDLADGGRLPAAVNAAWEAFQQAAGGGDDGADFVSAAAAMGLEIGTSPLDDDDQPPADQAGGGGQGPPPVPPVTAPPAGPPDGGGAAVTSLEEARQRVNASKASPAWAGKPSGRGQRAAPAGPEQPQGGRKRRSRAQQPAQPQGSGPQPIVVDQARLDDMAGKLSLMLMMPARTWQTLDPVCGGAAVESGPDIIDKWMPVLARSQAVVRLLSIDALFFQLLTAIQATWPLLDTIWQHHYSAEAREQQSLERRQQAQAQAAEEDLAMYPSAPPVSGHVPAYRPAQARM